MITLKQFLECIEYKITDGYDYQWACFGPNARGVGWDSENTASSASVIFSSVDQTVFEITAWDGPNSREYRRINPDFLDAYKKESKSRKIKFRESIDGRKYIDLEVEEDVIEKVSAIVAGKDYDTRVMIPLDLDDETELLLYKQAHLADMSVNDFVADILTNYIELRRKKKNGK
jgi:hypothetical protein